MVAFSSSCSLVLVLLALVPLSAVQAQLRVFNIRASGLPSDQLGITDGYVEVSSSSGYLGKTSVQHNDANPVWHEEFRDIEALPNDILRLTVHDSDVFFDDVLGTCEQSIKVGTFSHNCFLEEGSLSYSYSLD